jgi:ABC-type branched-subunit amino acid transport system substrate-binding protein
MTIGIGILRDHQTTGGDRFAGVIHFAFDDVRASGRLAHDLELTEEQADGLPQGTRESVEAAFRRLDGRDVLAVIGPGISDNGIIVRDLADDVRLPCINWTGGDVTRGEWMFHYQLGSLEEEPAFLALHLATRGHRRIALVHDDSLVGRRYVEFFDDAVARFGLEVVLLTDSTRDVRRLRAANPDAVLYLGLWFAARELGVALAASDWRPPVFSNSALMYGHASPDWRREWDGWCYVDAYSDHNPILQDVIRRLGDPAMAPVTVAAAYDMGRLVAEAVGTAPSPTRESVHEGFERIKWMPAALGAPGTIMGFGRWDRGALKGRYLVLRSWRDGASIDVDTP